MHWLAREQDWGQKLTREELSWLNWKAEKNNIRINLKISCYGKKLTIQTRLARSSPTLDKDNWEK